MSRWLNFKAISVRYKDFLGFLVFLRPYWKSALIVLVLDGLLVPLSLVTPYLTKLMIDKAYGNRDLSLFIALTLIGATVFVINAIIGAEKGYLEAKVRLKVNFDLNNKVFQHLQRLSLGFFQNKSTGEHIYLINSDLERITNMVVHTPSQFILLVPRFLLILAVIFYLNWRIALVAVIFAPLLCLQPYYFTKKRKKLFQQDIELSESLFVRLSEVFSHIHLVKAFGKEVFEIMDFLERLRQRMSLALKDLCLQVYSDLSGNGLKKITLGIVGLYGGYQIIQGQMTLGSLTAIMIYFTQVIGLQGSIVGMFEQLVYDFVSVDRVKKILDTPQDITDREDAISTTLVNADIEFKNVTFGYCPDNPVLKNLSFSIKPGLSIGLVGSSGCGKTTLLNLILRLYDVQGGRILVAGHDVKNIKSDSLKSQIGIALQEPFLWNDTFANNIRYARPGASWAEVKHAAQLAQIHHFIESLPKGYDTIVGEMANKISEGQKQRIAIARALVKHPAILILDEALSSVDSNTEEKIIASIKQELISSTVIVVSHRLSTAKNMDWVYFLEAMDKMRIGRHAELAEKSPEYRELFSGQI